MNSEGGNYEVDLTLKLGLPIEDNNQTINRQQVDCNPTTYDVTNFNFCGPYTSHQEAPNSYGMVSGGGQASMNVNGMVNRENAAVMNYGMVNHGVMGNIGNNQNDGQNFNLNESQIAWLQQNCMNSSNYQYGGGSVVGIPISGSNYCNTPVPTLNNYTLLDNSTRRVDIADIGGSSSINSRRKDSRRQRVGNYNDPTKRCSNYNCNTNDTPMWRKGPLGPKTLCNACGIKYRKEVEKRRAKEAATTSKSNG